ncbi:uncharacterized protein BX663DRAFT_489085 [Cokeromyces recurvatus]|uniref:uncharacterized protein n=1 Tax=Cokeromyces recurvatus TaxID=90255 RepID=UPI002221026A|nr:uncharacterized protein BX663DRAFT_489085 [Cokeromyces recurvatus]KAI7899644.1 hypothetical protein BX663DRAFT_489085 [Cokeromyces recurvatus]
MLDFIPFVSCKDETIEENLWEVALYSWTRNLAELLNLQDDAFLHETAYNESLSQFIDQVLNEQMDTEVAIDATLLRSIFLVYSRLASIHIPGPCPSLLLNVDRLSRFSIVYGESNVTQVRSIIKKLTSQYEGLKDEIVSLLNTVVDAVQSIPNLLSAPLSKSMLNRIYVLIRVLDSLLSSVLFVDIIRSKFETLDEILISCYQNMNPLFQGSVEKEDSLSYWVYLIKKTFISAFNLYADIHFFKPLGYISSIQDHHTLDRITDSVDNDDSTIAFMSHKLISYIEQSGLDTTRSAFLDAPLILDWEVEYDISNKLALIDRELFGGGDERIMFLVMSMEQVRDSNDDKGRVLLHDPSKKEQPDVTENIEKVSQIHDLFPELGDGFIEACLEASHYDAELVIMQLLEDTLPDSVRQLDRKMERRALLPPDAVAQPDDELQRTEPSHPSLDSNKESILKTRRNIYDHDEFDIFNRPTVDSSKMYIGKKDKGNADLLLNDKSFIQAEKKNVLKRVVDMYDDEYDDTYDDINDVGVPASMENGDDTAIDIIKRKQEVVDPGVINESLLVHTFVDHPELFVRNSTARKSAKRAELRKQTGMSNEQLEGWAIMFNRNPRKNKILDKYMLFDGNQNQVTEETSQAQKDSQGKENKRPPVSETQERTYKNKNKARFANHNRKAMRDKKVSKNMPPPN